MIPEFTHKINERLVLVREEKGTSEELTIRRISDGSWFNFMTGEFEAYNSANVSSYTETFAAFDDNPGLVRLNILTLPTVAQDLIFAFTSKEVEVEPSVFEDVTEYQRHLFGGRQSINEPTTCKVYGTLKDVSGSPLEGQKVEAYLNRAGYFTHKAGLIGYQATSLTDESGYFELPLIVGLDVTISVPIIGFTQRGFVPNVTSVELTSQTLLSYQPSY